MFKKIIHTLSICISFQQIAVIDIANDEGKALEKELNERHGNNKVRFIKCDITDEEQLFKAFDTIINENGCIDVVINNAGIMNDDPKVFKKSIAVNVVSN